MQVTGTEEKEMPGGQEPWGQTHPVSHLGSLSHSSCVALGKSLYLSEPQGQQRTTSTSRANTSTARANDLCKVLSVVPDARQVLQE